MRGQDGEKSASSIGTLQESSLHAALKKWYARPGDELEVRVGQYHVDIVRGDKLIEIQTANFSAIRSKLRSLLKTHRVELVHPIAQERWVCRVTGENRLISRRKSPKRGRVEDMFTELVRLPDVASHERLSLVILFIQEEIVWRDDGRGSWRRKGWSVADRRLLKVVDQVRFDSPEDYLALVPSSLEDGFTNADLAKRLKVARRLAERISYTLVKMGLVEIAGKRGRANLYRPASID